MSEIDSDEDRDVAMLRHHAALLSEHFGSVQIIATRTEGDYTISCDGGAGDWYARYGAAKAWVRKHESTMKIAEES